MPSRITDIWFEPRQYRATQGRMVPDTWCARVEYWNGVSWSTVPKWKGISPDSISEEIASRFGSCPEMVWDISYQGDRAWPDPFPDGSDREQPSGEHADCEKKKMKQTEVKNTEAGQGVVDWAPRSDWPLMQGDKVSRAMLCLMFIAINWFSVSVILWL